MKKTNLEYTYCLANLSIHIRQIFLKNIYIRFIVNNLISLRANVEIPQIMTYRIKKIKC